MVTGGNEYRPWLKHEILALALDLSKLRMSPAAVDNLGKVNFLLGRVVVQPVPLSLEPCKGAAE